MSERISWGELRDPFLQAKLLSNNLSAQKHNSEADPILSNVTNIIYEVSMLVIVKRELTDDDDMDCEIISVQPVPQDFLPKDVTVKQEKINPRYDNLDNNGNPVIETEEKNKEEKSQAHEDEAAEGDTEGNKDETGNAENTPKKPQKNSKKKPSVAPAGKRTLQSAKSKTDSQIVNDTSF